MQELVMEALSLLTGAVQSGRRPDSILGSSWLHEHDARWVADDVA